MPVAYNCHNCDEKFQVGGLVKGHTLCEPCACGNLAEKLKIMIDGVPGVMANMYEENVINEVCKNKTVISGIKCHICDKDASEHGFIVYKYIFCDNPECVKKAVGVLSSIKSEQVAKGGL